MDTHLNARGHLLPMRHDQILETTVFESVGQTISDFCTDGLDSVMDRYSIVLDAISVGVKWVQSLHSLLQQNIHALISEAANTHKNKNIQELVSKHASVHSNSHDLCICLFTPLVWRSGGL